MRLASARLNIIPKNTLPARPIQIDFPFCQIHSTAASGLPFLIASLKSLGIEPKLFYPQTSLWITLPNIGKKLFDAVYFTLDFNNNTLFT